MPCRKVAPAHFVRGRRRRTVGAVTVGSARLPLSTDRTSPAAAFFERSDDDIGAIREVSFGRAHALGGRETGLKKDDTTDPAKRPVLLEHDLDRRAGTHLWRFALRLTSRYAAMRPNHPDLFRFSHVQKEANRTQWWNLVVPDRVQPDRPPRAVARPGLMLVVPLTETEMTAGSVPPPLAVFNQELFPQFNAADGIETVIDVARHPLPGAKRIDEAKFGTEFKDKWDDVRKKRDALHLAEERYADKVRVDSRATLDEQNNAKKKRDDARTALAEAETVFKKLQYVAGAFGVVEQWKAVRKQVEEALAKAKSQEEKDRLNARLAEIDDVEGPQAKAQAQVAEQKPIAIAGAPADPFTKYFQEQARIRFAIRRPLPTARSRSASTDRSATRSTPAWRRAASITAACWCRRSRK